MEADRIVAAPRLGPVVAFVLLFGAVWLSLYAAYVLLPFLRPGSVIIADAKFDTLVKGPMFGPQDRYRVMVFGHSKVLSGLRPSVVDAALGPGFHSYNLGLPGEVRFLPILETALAAGNIPTHVLLTLPWDGKTRAEGFVDIMRDDNALANLLFPFRYLARDSALFVFENTNRLAEAVRDVETQRTEMLADGGWYFINSQSHYNGDRLPDNYTLPTDHPDRVALRTIPEKSLSRDRLERLARRYGFQILFVPSFYRIGEVAPFPASENTRSLTISAEPHIRLLGPDYFTFPPALFSDPQHVNPAGADAYSASLAKVLKASGVFD